MVLTKPRKQATNRALGMTTSTKDLYFDLLITTPRPEIYACEGGKVGCQIGSSFVAALRSEFKAAFTKANPIRATKGFPLIVSEKWSETNKDHWPFENPTNATMPTSQRANVVNAAITRVKQSRVAALQTADYGLSQADATKQAEKESKAGLLHAEGKFDYEAAVKLGWHKKGDLAKPKTGISWPKSLSGEIPPELSTIVTLMKKTGVKRTNTDPANTTPQPPPKFQKLDEASSPREPDRGNQQKRLREEKPDSGFVDFMSVICLDDELKEVPTVPEILAAAKTTMSMHKQSLWGSSNESKKFHRDRLDRVNEAVAELTNFDASGNKKHTPEIHASNMSRFISRRKKFLALKQSYEARTGKIYNYGYPHSIDARSCSTKDCKICPPRDTLDRILPFVKPAGSDENDIPPAERGSRIGSYLPDLHTIADARGVYVHVRGNRKVFRLGMFSAADSRVTGGRLSADEEVDIDSITWDSTKFPTKITDLSEYEVVFNELRASNFLPQKIKDFVQFKVYLQVFSEEDLQATQNDRKKALKILTNRPDAYDSQRLPIWRPITVNGYETVVDAYGQKYDVVVDISRRLVRHIDQPNASESGLAQTSATDSSTRGKANTKVDQVVPDEAGSIDVPEDPDAKAMRDFVASQANADRNDDEVWKASYLHPFVRFSRNMTDTVIEMIQKSPQKQLYTTLKNDGETIVFKLDSFLSQQPDAVKALEAAYPDEPHTTDYAVAQLTQDPIYKLVPSNDKIENWISQEMRKVNPSNDPEISKQVRGGAENKIQLHKVIERSPNLLRDLRLVCNKSMTREEAENERRVARDKALHGPKHEREQAMEQSGLRFLIAYVPEVKSFIENIMQNSDLDKNPEYTNDEGQTWMNHEKFLANNKSAYDHVNNSFTTFFPVWDTSKLKTKAEQDRTTLFTGQTLTNNKAVKSFLLSRYEEDEGGDRKNVDTHYRGGGKSHNKPDAFSNVAYLRAHPKYIGWIAALWPTLVPIRKPEPDAAFVATDTSAWNEQQIRDHPVHEWYNAHADLEQDDDLAQAMRDTFDQVMESYENDPKKAGRFPKPQVVEVENEDEGEGEKSTKEKEPTKSEILEAFPEAIGEIEAELKFTVPRPPRDYCVMPIYESAE